MAVLVPSLVRLRTEFNVLAPDRDKESDGWIGDTAHQEEPSDHNPDSRGLVHAIDVDRDLRGDADMQDVVDLLVRRHAAGLDRRLKYVIFNRRIWSASHDWKPRVYTGKNPHDHHAHFSAVSTPSLEQNTSSWHLEELVAALTEEQTRKIVRDELAAFAKAALSTGGGSRDGGITTLLARTGAATNKQLPALTVAVGQLAARQMDPAALIGALVPALTDALIGALPADRDDITPAELKDAVLAAVRELVGQPS